MALRAVTDHPKFSRLKMLLKLNKSCALGYLEALWHFCGKYTPQGNVGKYSDADIEAWLEWDGEEGALVAACLKSGWLEANAVYRLIVHDWSQYADEIVHTDLARKCMLFADGTLPKTGRLNKYERERFHAAFPEDRTPPNSQAPDIPDLFGDASQTESDSAQTNPAAVTKPEPEPEPEPAGKQKPSRGKREGEVDPRHALFKSACEAYARGKRVTFVWDGSEGKALDLLLKAAPSLTLLEFQQCIDNRARSPGTPHGERPRIWIPNVLRYQQGRVNEFGKTEEARRGPFEPGIYKGPTEQDDEQDDEDLYAYWRKMKDRGNEIYKTAPLWVREKLEAKKELAANENRISG